jgi:hypothetical protein
MQDWCDTDAILDDIISILRPESSTDFAQKQAQARAVPVTSVRDMANATEMVYHEVLSRQVVKFAAPLPQTTLYAALQTALGVAAADKHRALSIGEHWLLRLAHLGLRLRYTLLGRWLYRIIPVRWQQILKQRLLA